MRNAPRVISGTPDELRRLQAELLADRDDPARWMARRFLINSRLPVVPIRPLALSQEARPGQMSVYRALREQQRRRHNGQAYLYVLKGRRAGVTTLMQALNLHEAWWFNDRDVWTFAHQMPKMRELFEITRLAVERYPLPDLIPARHPREATEIAFRHGSTFRIGTGGSVDSARGSGVHQAHVSEFAFLRDPLEFLRGLLPGLADVAGARVVLETTAGGYGSDAHGLWRDSVEGRGKFEALFLPWWQCRPLDYRIELEAPDELGRLEDDERALVDRHGLDLAQIKWRRTEMAGPGGRAAFLTEYAEDDASCWTSISGARFDAEILRYLLVSAPAPVAEQAGNKPARWYSAEDRPLAAGERAVIGADGAEGVGGDRSVWVAREASTWRPLAAFASPRMIPEEFAKHLAAWGMRFADERGLPAFLVPERNGPGLAIIRTLLDECGYPARRIYHRAATADRRSEVPGDRIGWQTTGGPTGSKHLLISALESWFAAARREEVPGPLEATVRDAFSVLRSSTGAPDTQGRDWLIAEALALMGREWSSGGLSIA